MHNITVKELRELLEGCNPDALVVLSRDEEGNGFLPLCDISTQYSYCMKMGEIGYAELTKKALDEGYTKSSLFPDGTSVPAVVLWPNG